VDCGWCLEIVGTHPLTLTRMKAMRHSHRNKVE
jgi:hypothetical protein